MRFSDLVLKPASVEHEIAWEAAHVAPIPGAGFRLAQPVRSEGGEWVVEGWSARRFLDGADDPTGRWSEKVDVSRAFHAAIAHLPAPGWLVSRTDRWAIADRAAFDEEAIAIHPSFAPLVERVRRSLKPVASSSQLVHGDKSGNVLFAEREPPAVIDLSLYWRPAAFGVAVLAVDAISWEDAPLSLLEYVKGDAEIEQMLLRALLFRILASNPEAIDENKPPIGLDTYACTLEVILAADGSA